jgi:hypothetical protein
MGNASMGWAAAFGAGATDPVTRQFEFFSCSIGKRPSLIESPGIRGTRSHIKESVTTGAASVGGSVVMEPRPDELDFWLPYILGATENANVFALAETLPECYVTVDKVAKVYTYAGMKVNRALFGSAEGANPNLRMTLDLEGKTETEAAAGTFPAISTTLSVLQPFTHLHSVLTVSSSQPIRNVQVEINNALILDRFMNTAARTELPASDRIVRVTCDNPFTADEVSLYSLALAGSAATLVYTNGAKVLTFTFANLKAAPVGPEIPSRETEIPLRMELVAFQSGGTKELVITNVS